MSFPGNHDRRDSFQRGVVAFARRDRKTLQYMQFANDDHPVRLVMMDTVVICSGHGEIRTEQMAWH